MSNEIIKGIFSAIRSNRIISANRAAGREVREAKTRAKYYEKLCEEGLIKAYSGENVKFEDFVRYFQSFKISTEQLPALRRVFGEVKDDKNYSVADAEQRLINVNLDCGTEVESAMKFYYVTELPPDAKCKIVKQSYDTVACDL